jgi:putative Mg2+ transporter-C (MgtC) family protein
MESTIDVFYILESLGLTLFFVGLIGYERQSKHKVAGLTTHMLVALGAASLAITQEYLYQDSIALINELSGTNPDIVSAVTLERQRIIAQIVAGVGFLGTGAIIKTNGYITGLTTASTLWISAIIGITFGIGHYLLGIIVSVLALLTLILVKRLFKGMYDEER